MEWLKLVRVIDKYYKEDLQHVLDYKLIDDEKGKQLVIFYKMADGGDDIVATGEYFKNDKEMAITVFDDYNQTFSTQKILTKEKYGFKIILGEAYDYLMQIVLDNPKKILKVTDIENNFVRENYLK